MVGDIDITIRRAFPFDLYPGCPVSFDVKIVSISDRIVNLPFLNRCAFLEIRMRITRECAFFENEIRSLFPGR